MHFVQIVQKPYFLHNVYLHQKFVQDVSELYLNDEIKKKHIKRLRKGKCTIELGFVLSDLTTNFERVADHCSNIAVCLIQTQADGYEMHEYLDKLKEDEDPFFGQMFEEYCKEYRLPS